MAKTRVVLMLDDLEFARLAGAAAGAQLNLQDFIKRELKLSKPTINHACPACNGPMRPKKIQNATSRFITGIYVCSSCGVREALEGQFWTPNLRSAIRIAKQQEQWT